MIYNNLKKNLKKCKMIIIFKKNNFLIKKKNLFKKQKLLKKLILKKSILYIQIINKNKKHFKYRLMKIYKNKNKIIMNQKNKKDQYNHYKEKINI